MRAFDVQVYYAGGYAELRVFHAHGYDSLRVPGTNWLEAASQARLDYAKVDRIRAIDWSWIDAIRDLCVGLVERRRSAGVDPMGLILNFEVPGPPVPAARARIVRKRPGSKPRGFTPKKTAVYEETVGHFAMRAMAAACWPRGGRGPFGLRVDVYREADRGDASNYWPTIG